MTDTIPVLAVVIENSLVDRRLTRHEILSLERGKSLRICSVGAIEAPGCFVLVEVM
jgi:hypothetical protein